MSIKINQNTIQPAFANNNSMQDFSNIEVVVIKVNKVSLAEFNKLYPDPVKPASNNKSSSPLVFMGNVDPKRFLKLLGTLYT